MALSLLSGAKIFGAVAGLFGAPDKNPGRFATNEEAYRQAQAGSLSALNYLRGRSGDFGKISNTWTGDTTAPAVIGGWATQEARDDARKKYKAIEAAGAVGFTQPAPAGTKGSASVPITSATSGQSIAPAPGSLPELNVQAAPGAGWLWPVLGVGLVLLTLGRK